MISKHLLYPILVAGSAGHILSEEVAQTPPNVVFILTDDLGWGDLGCYGNPYIKTPNIDKLAQQGVLLENFYVNAPVCAPTRASFMTGRYPISIGLPHIVMKGEQAKKYGSVEYLDPSIMTVTRLLQQVGYKTGHFGKWHLGFKDGPEISRYGIDESVTADGNGPQFPLYESRKKEDRVAFRGRSSELIVDAAIDFIDRHRTQPFYVNIWSLVPHAPLLPTPEQLAVYDSLKQPDFIPFVSSRQIYYAAITDLDKQVGRLLDRLDELGLTDNTIVVFSSDNGPENALINNAGYSASGSSGPFRGCKRSLYDGGTRVPFLIRWPGHIPSGAVDKKSVVAGMDFLPTLASLCGIKLPDNMILDGEDRSVVLTGVPTERSNPVFWEWRSRIYAHCIHQSPRFALRDGPWKFLMNDDDSRIELYFVPDDPCEINNLVNKEPGRVARYTQLIKEFSEKMPAGPVQPEAGKLDLYVPMQPDDRD